MTTSPASAAPFADLALARRLERAEATSNVRFVEARAAIMPDVGASWIAVAGAHAMFDGRDSPLTQTFGLGLFAEPTPADFDQLEAFFLERGAPVCHEVSPLADAATLAQLTARRYEPCEFTSVMYRPIDSAAPRDTASGVVARPIEPEERERWAALSAEGWREFPEFAPLMLDLARVVAHSRNTAFVAERDGRGIATGALAMHDGVALLAGASTVPEARRMGAQHALLTARLDAAARQGCGLAMMCAQPGSASQRNAERQGFRIAYTRIKWRLSAR